MIHMRRPYAKRLLGANRRSCQVGFRLSPVALQFLRHFASERRMSVSEYVARLVCDHLTLLSRGAA